MNEGGDMRHRRLIKMIARLLYYVINIQRYDIAAVSVTDFTAFVLVSVIRRGQVQIK